jgi:hypothetical protein
VVPVVKEDTIGLEDNVALTHAAVAEGVASGVQAANENSHLEDDTKSKSQELVNNGNN